MSLYATVLLLSISIPIGLSFEKKLSFYRLWKYLFPSIFLVAAFYLIVDVYFTNNGIWAFNPRYHSNILILNVPLEEWLFFLIIPYASLFIHESIALYFPEAKLKTLYSFLLTIALLIISILLFIFNFDRTYTAYISLVMIIALLFALFDRKRLINQFYVSFLVILIPFLIVNSILTGSFIEESVFWYNSSDILGIRIFTIPIEDFGYAFSLIFFNLLLMNKFKNMNYASTSI
jgi:lycopene cyclase domain-containing protein